jgi:tetratricopeptide (TPR) repeat protein
MNIIDIISAINEFEERFKDAAYDINKVTRFWNDYNRNPLPGELMNMEQYHILRERMFTLLRACKRIDSDAYENIHKGHPFFFIGISSFRLRDYQTAISFFDAALSEDLKIEDGKERPTDLFFNLRGDNPKNAAQGETIIAQNTVIRSIWNYNEIISQNKAIQKLSIDQLRDCFISRILIEKDDLGFRTLLTTFITFLVEWEFRDSNFELGIKKGTAEPLFMHLFRGCVLFESLLLRNPNRKPEHNNKKDLNDLINYYKEEMHLKKKGDFLRNPIPLKTLEKLLSNLNDSNKTIDHSIKISYWLRNNLGHNIAWEATINRESYRKLYYSVIYSCLHVINCLWKSPI